MIAPQRVAVVRPTACEQAAWQPFGLLGRMRKRASPRSLAGDSLPRRCVGLHRGERRFTERPAADMRALSTGNNWASVASSSLNSVFFHCAHA